MCEGPQFGEHRARLEGLRSCMSETEGGMRGGWRGKRDGASLLEADDNIVWQVDHDQHLRAPGGDLRQTLARSV